MATMQQKNVRSVSAEFFSILFTDKPQHLQEDLTQLFSKATTERRNKFVNDMNNK